MVVTMNNPYAYNIRKATNADGPAISDLVFCILRDYGLEPDPDATDADLKDIEGSYFRSGGSFYVFENDGEIIGSAGLYPVSDDTAELRKMYLHARCRGRGIGKLLLDKLVADARQSGFSKVTLETASVLKEAIQLYKQYGFKEYNPGHLCSRCDQAYHLEI
jgi:putative acetyltransferase